MQLFKRFVPDPAFVIVEVNSPDDVDIPTKVLQMSHFFTRATAYSQLAVTSICAPRACAWMHAQHTRGVSFEFCLWVYYRNTVRNS